MARGGNEIIKARKLENRVGIGLQDHAIMRLRIGAENLLQFRSRISSGR